MDNTAGDNKQTFLQLRRVHNLKLETIAEMAGVSIEDIYYLEAGLAYPKEFITKVLSAVSTLTNQHYTMENVLSIYALGEEIYGQ
jgi:hypothetical protein